MPVSGETLQETSRPPQAEGLTHRRMYPRPLAGRPSAASRPLRLRCGDIVIPHHSLTRLGRVVQDVPSLPFGSMRSNSLRPGQGVLRHHAAAAGAELVPARPATPPSWLPAATYAPYAHASSRTRSDADRLDRRRWAVVRVRMAIPRGSMGPLPRFNSGASVGTGRDAEPPRRRPGREAPAPAGRSRPALSRAPGGPRSGRLPRRASGAPGARR